MHIDDFQCTCSNRPDRFKRLIYREIYKSDDYRLNHAKQYGIEYVIDIGANIGMFSVRAAEELPDVKRIIAIEPTDKTIVDLWENIQNHTDKIFVEHCAIGIGDPLYLHKHNSVNPGSNTFKTAPNPKQVQKVESFRLRHFFEKHEIPLDSRFMIKVDCEGGEHFLMDDPDCREILEKCVLMCFEVHGNRKNEFLDWLGTFALTHNVRATYKNNSGNGSGSITRLDVDSTAQRTIDDKYNEVIARYESEIVGYQRKIDAYKRNMDIIRDVKERLESRE